MRLLKGAFLYNRRRAWLTNCTPSKCNHLSHYSDVIMSAMASHITNLTIVYSTVYSSAYLRIYQTPRRWPLWGEFTGEFPKQMASNAENASIWWRHHSYPTFNVDERIVASRRVPGIPELKPLCGLQQYLCSAFNAKFQNDCITTWVTASSPIQHINGFTVHVLLWLPYNSLWFHGPLARYAKLRVTHAPGIPRTFSPPPRVSDPDMYHDTCVTHVPWCRDR